MAGHSWVFVGVASLLVVSCWCQLYVAAQAYDYHYLEDDCRLNRSIDIHEDGMSLYGFVRVTRNKQYKRDQHCALTVWAPDNHRLTTRIRWMDIHCDHAQLIITGSNDSEPLKLCGRYQPTYSVSSLTRKLTFEFWADENSPTDEDRIGFDLHYTAFHRDGCDSNTEFKCYYENRCIPKEVKCDNLDNCGDWSDERSSACGLSTAAIVCITLLTVLVVGACVGCCVYVYRDDKRKKKEQQRRRQNREASVEYVRTPTTTTAGATQYEMPPNQYAAGVEPPPPYTYAIWPPPGGEEKKYLAMADPNMAAGYMATPSTAGAAGSSGYVSNPLYAPQDSAGVANPACEDAATESSAMAQGAPVPAAPAPNIPPPVYQELPPVDAQT